MTVALVLQGTSGVLHAAEPARPTGYLGQLLDLAGVSPADGSVVVTQQPTATHAADGIVAVTMWWRVTTSSSSATVAVRHYLDEGLAEPILQPHMLVVTPSADAGSTAALFEPAVSGGEPLLISELSLHEPSLTVDLVCLFAAFVLPNIPGKLAAGVCFIANHGGRYTDTWWAETTTSRRNQGTKTTVEQRDADGRISMMAHNWIHGGSWCEVTMAVALGDSDAPCYYRDVTDVQHQNTLHLNLLIHWPDGVITQQSFSSNRSQVRNIYQTSDIRDGINHRRVALQNGSYDMRVFGRGFASYYVYGHRYTAGQRIDMGIALWRVNVRP